MKQANPRECEPDAWWHPYRYSEFLESRITPDLEDAMLGDRTRRALLALAEEAKYHCFNSQQCIAHFLELCRFYCLGLDENGKKKYPVTKDNVPETHEMRIVLGQVFRVKENDEYMENLLRSKGFSSFEEYEKQPLAELEENEGEPTTKDVTLEKDLPTEEKSPRREDTPDKENSEEAVPGNDKVLTQSPVPDEVPIEDMVEPEMNIEIQAESESESEDEAPIRKKKERLS